MCGGRESDENGEKKRVFQLEKGEEKEGLCGLCIERERVTKMKRKEREIS